MATARTILRDHPDYRIELIVPEQIDPDLAGKLLVGFGPINSGFDDPGFGEVLSEKIGVAYAAVRQRKGTQYQLLSREVMTEVFGDLHDRYELFFYGSSVGAYCAAYFARPLGANFLALSPRIPTHPLTSLRISTKFPTAGYHHVPVYEGDAPSGAPRQIVAYDPDNHVDSFYVDTDLALAFPELEVHRLPNAGHYTARALMLSQTLKPAVLDFLTHRPLRLTVDSDAVVLWHNDRFSSMLAKRKFGLASEHLEVLMRNQDAETTAQHVRAMNLATAEAAEAAARRKQTAASAPAAPAHKKSFAARVKRRLTR